MSVEGTLVSESSAVRKDEKEMYLNLLAMRLVSVLQTPSLELGLNLGQSHRE